MKVLRTWVRLPAPWVQGYGLRRLKWVPGQGADNTAALMVLIVLAHHVEQDTNVSKIIYDDLCGATGLSRPKVAAGIQVLIREGLIESNVEGRSTYRLTGYEDGVKWGKLPARSMYSGKIVNAFRDFTLRNQSELNAMKLFILFVIRRNNKENIVQISYDKILEYTEIPKHRIRSAITLLGSIGLLHLERTLSKDGDGAMFNAYRIPHIDPFNHPAAQTRTQ